MGAGEKLTLIWELTTTFVTFWNSCVALKRTVFCKRCYCCLMPVIFAWNSAKYLSDLCRDLSGKTCFNFGCWFPDLYVSQTSIFFRSLYYFFTLDSFLSQLVIRILLLLPLWQNLMTFRSMIVFLFYRCVICVKHLHLQLNRVFFSHNFTRDWRV